MKFKFNKVKSNYSVCVVDNIGGTFLPIAHRMSDFFERVYYHSVSQSPFPRASMEKIGCGYENIIRLDEFWNNLDKIDIIIFPDLYFNDWGMLLRSMGKMVWGGCESDVLENNRVLFRNELSGIGLPTAPAKMVQGMENLIKELNGVENKWVKLSYYRGEMETFRHINMKQSEVFLNQLKHEMGPLAEDMEFIIEDNIESIAEVGYDGWLVNGYPPSSLIWGLEVKDCGYIGKAAPFDQMPFEVQEIATQFTPILNKYKHTGFYSTEIRVGEDKTPYYTDICGRAGSPPSCTYMMMIDNWDQIIINGCKGVIVEPNFCAEYGVEIILKSDFCNKGFLPVEYPEEFSSNVKLKSAFVKGGKEYIVPFPQAGFAMNAFGSVVVVGNDLDEIMGKALEICGEINAYGLDYNANTLMKAREQLGRVEGALNVKF